MSLESLIQESKRHVEIVKDLDSSDGDYIDAKYALHKLFYSMMQYPKEEISIKIDDIPHFFLEKLLATDILTPLARKKALKLIHPAKRVVESVIFDECPVCLEFKAVIPLESCRHHLCAYCSRKIRCYPTIRCPCCRTISKVK